MNKEKAVEKAVDFFMDILETRKFEELYREYEETADDTKLRQYIQFRVENRNN